MTSRHPARLASRWITDEELGQLIRSYIDDDPSFWTGLTYAHEMVVIEVQDGIVTLSGLVRSSSDRRKVDTLVRKLGALGVDNRLHAEGEITHKSA